MRLFRRDKKTAWDVVDETFRPESAGFVFDPSMSILSLSQMLLKAFAEKCPDPENFASFIGAILLDGIGYWQVLEELELLGMGKERDEFLYDMKLWGFPVWLCGMEGIALALSPELAPAVLRQQIGEKREEARAIEEGRKGYGELRVGVAEASAENGFSMKIKKEEMH